MAVQWVPDEPRVFDLGLRSRTVDHNAMTVTLTLASDEALLTDYATLTDDRGPAAQTTIRGIVNYVLGKIGAALDPAGPDVPFPETEPDALTWRAGTSAWDFLEPLNTSAGLRLFCDEHRVWRLVDPTTYKVPGYIELVPDTLTEGADTVSREDADIFATGVVVRYAWQDSAGDAHTAYDAAGTPEKVFVVEHARPYPGPGAAQAILNRRNGAGRVQDVTAIALWDTTPGMVGIVSLPGVNSQNGKVYAVTWALDDTSLMDVTTRALIDSVPGAWIDWDPGQAWEDVDPSITWASLAL